VRRICLDRNFSGRDRLGFGLLSLLLLWRCVCKDLAFCSSRASDLLVKAEEKCFVRFDAILCPRCTADGKGLARKAEFFRAWGSTHLPFLLGHTIKANGTADFLASFQCSPW